MNKNNNNDSTALDAAVLGGTIRSTRKLKGLKLRAMADLMGCSESLLSKIENGRITPSLSTLGRIATSLDVEMGDLFSPRDPQRVIARAGSRPSLVLHGEGSTVERLVPPGRGHLLESNLHSLAPGASSLGSLSHEGEEVGYVIEGTFELTVGDEVFVLHAGDSFTFRSEVAHAYRNPGKAVARVLWASTPSRSAAAGANAARLKPS